MKKTLKMILRKCSHLCDQITLFYLTSAMSIIAQWEGFSPSLLLNSGYKTDFYPFKFPMITNQVSQASSGYIGVSYIGVKTIIKHKDPLWLERYSAFLVLRNDGAIAKGGSQPKSKYELQRPGVIVILNIHVKVVGRIIRPDTFHAIHHAIPDKRIAIPGKSPCWIAASISYPSKPKSSEVEEYFRKFLKWKKEMG